LTPVSDQIAIVGQQFHLVINAVDYDVPSQKLTYELIQAPSGVVLNSGTGALEWTPESTQIGTNQITVRVSDNGQPSLSDQMSFKIIVKPGNEELKIISIAVMNQNSIQLTIKVKPGASYKVQYKDDITSSSWVDSQTITPTTDILNITNNIGTNRLRFYRVVEINK
jgi:hypothetical protein